MSRVPVLYESSSGSCGSSTARVAVTRVNNRILRELYCIHTVSEEGEALMKGNSADFGSRKLVDWSGQTKKWAVETVQNVGHGECHEYHNG